MQKKILVLHYYPGAGGKFVLNCLGHNKGFAIGDSTTADAMLDKFDILEIQKLMLATGPRRDQMRQWSKYEKYGCRELFGSGIYEVFQFCQLIGDFFQLLINWLPVITGYHWYLIHVNRCST